MGDTKRQATSGEVVSLRKENSQLKEIGGRYVDGESGAQKGLTGKGGDLDE